jgi:hypothetical protein
MFSKTVIAAVFAAVVAAQQNPTTAPATGEVSPFPSDVLDVLGLG